MLNRIFNGMLEICSYYYGDAFCLEPLGLSKAKDDKNHG